MENTKERVTIYEVAKASGVSLATVSRVINNTGTVKEDTKRTVLSVIKKLGYKPSGLAQALATNRTTNIGVIIPSANYVYISNLVNGITQVCKDKGFTLLLYTTSHSREDALGCLERVIKSHVDGVIVFDDELNGEDLEVFNSYGVPVIDVNNNVIASKIGCIPFGYEHLIKRIIEENFIRGDKKMTFLHVHNAGRLLSRVENTFIKVHMENDREYNLMNCDDSYNRTYQDFMERVKPDAIARIKTSLVLDAVATAENIVISEDEINEEIQNMATMYQMDFDSLKEMVSENEIKAISKDLAAKKALALIGENCKEV